MTTIELAMRRMNQQPPPVAAAAPWPDAVHRAIEPAMDESREGPIVDARPVVPPPPAASCASAGGQDWTPKLVVAVASVCLPAVLALAYFGGYRSTLVASDATAVVDMRAPDVAPVQAPAVALQPKATPGPGSGLAPVDLRADAAATIRRWAAAWSARDVGRYLGFYAGQFEPPGRLSRSAWEEQRRKRILGKQRVSVVIEDLNVELLDTDRAIAQFAQTYEADDHREFRTPKTLVLAREENTWRIASETAQADAAARRMR